ncbi:MAG: hypothetical protein BYD32DRAFT_492294 [Podila humilis]|nr:MAG: hypothetical protein BYD32DRAFT_492294 [Podila humilis]
MRPQPFAHSSLCFFSSSPFLGLSFPTHPSNTPQFLVLYSNYFHDRHPFLQSYFFLFHWHALFLFFLGFLSCCTVFLFFLSLRFLSVLVLNL